VVVSINRNTYLDIVMRTGAANEANLLHDEFTGTPWLKWNRYTTEEEEW
jgi:hypothetical protein